MRTQDLLKGKMNFQPTEVKVTEKDVHIHPKIQRDLDGVIAAVTNSDVFGTQMGYSGVLFSGPPGTGKTLTAQYLAQKAEAVFIDASGVSTGDQIAQLYDAARKARDEQEKPVLIFFDEVDRFSSRDDIVDPMQYATLNQLLMQMSGTASNARIKTIGASNKPNKIDRALRRPGRFEKEVTFLPPDEEGRLHILRIHAYEKDHKFEIKEDDLKKAAEETYGYTGADLVYLLNEAFTNALLEGRQKVTSEDVSYALEHTEPSAIRDMPFEEPKLKFDKLGGYEIHKELIKRVVEHSNGTTIMFYGPKGTGKTAFAEAVAGEYRFNYIIVRGTELEDKWVGGTKDKLERVHERAKQLAPCVLVYDEFDSFIEKEGVVSHKGSWTGYLQSKLSKPPEGVYIIATMNRPHLLSGAFRDRFVHKLFFGLPPKDAQKKIWEIHTELSDEDIQTLLKEGITCRDIARTSQLVSEYGLEPSVRVYSQLIAVPSPNGTDYDEVRKEVGDNLADYAKVKEILASEKAEAGE